jgi:hypothetical protein
MPDTPPHNIPEVLYDAMARNGLFDLPPASLARLALSEAARDLSDEARALVPTTSDDHARPGEFIEAAQQLVGAAQEVLERAVVYERQQGRSWEVVGEALGIARQSAHERFAEAEERWHDGLDRPYIIPEDGSLARSNLPDGADAPRDCMRWLDEWCERYVEPGDASTGAHQVSASLVDEDRLTLQLMNAVTGQSTRLLQGPVGVGRHPVAERTFWERKLRLAERLVAENPDDAGARQMVTDAQTKLDELRRSGLRLVQPDNSACTAQGDHA